MAVRHERYVNIYRGGSPGQVVQRAKNMRRYGQEAKKRQGYLECSGCGNFYLDPLRNHYADFKNKIRCMDRGLIEHEL